MWLVVLIGLLSALAASAQDVKVSIDVNRQPLAKVLTMLEQQSGYRFFYSNDLVADVKPVTIKVSDMALSAVLQRILPERNLTYKVEKKQIVLTAAVTGKSDSKPAAPAAVTVRGRVTDSTGEPLVGVSVKSGSQGVTTDIDGNYSINVAPGAKLEFSYVGCVATTKKATADKPVDVVMADDTELLNEVVVIGYGTMDKKELTSAISHVSEKDFLTISAADPAALIKGKVSGVSIVNTGAADPNMTSSIQVRGVNSRQAGLGPLIVIDGVPGGNLQNVNPNDIASFDVLKDGAASAIYGTRGANGVILVTTKKGSKDGAVHTTYSATLSWDKMKNELEHDECRRLPPRAPCMGRYRQRPRRQLRLARRREPHWLFAQAHPQPLGRQRAHQLPRERRLPRRARHRPLLQARGVRRPCLDNTHHQRRPLHLYGQCGAAHSLQQPVGLGRVQAGARSQPHHTPYGPRQSFPILQFHRADGLHQSRRVTEAPQIEN